MDTTDGLVRGMPVENTGAPIRVPVGREVLGRIMNVVGLPVDERGPITTKKDLPIHRAAPLFVDQSVRSGVRYIYAVIAIDTHLPSPNVSGESARIEETAR